MTGQIDRATRWDHAGLSDRAALIVQRFLTALPVVLLILLLAGIGIAEGATHTCRGESLVPALEAEGKLDEAREKAAAVPNGQGRLFRIERDGFTPSYLFGTMHMSDPRVLELSPATETAFSTSDRLVIETTDITDPVKSAAMIWQTPELVTLPAGKTLADYLDPAQEETLRAALREKGVPLQSVETLQPWFLSVGFMMPACEKARTERGALALDADLARRAEAAGKPVEGLETAVEQLSAIASIPLKQQMDGFVAVLEIDDALEDVFETMIDLYLKGEVAMILPAVEAAVPNGGMLVGAGEGYDGFEEKVVIERNLRMAERMQPFLAEGASFIAVGALHLPGEKGLVALLRERSYTVSRADRADVAEDETGDESVQRTKK